MAYYFWRSVVLWREQRSWRGWRKPWMADGKTG